MVGPCQRATAAPFEYILQKQMRVEARYDVRGLDSNHFDRLTVDCHPDVVLGAVDSNFRLIDGNFLTSPAVGLENASQPMKRLTACFIRPVKKWFAPPP